MGSCEGALFPAWCGIKHSCLQTKDPAVSERAMTLDNDEINNVSARLIDRIESWYMTALADRRI